MNVNQMLKEEGTIKDLLDKEKGFQYKLKKVRNKYYIYFSHNNKKALSKGIENLIELGDLVRILLSKSLFFKQMSKKQQFLITSRYIKLLKKSLEE